MPTEDYSIKVGTEVDDSGIDKLKEISAELRTVADSLKAINQSQISGNVFSGLSSAEKSLKNVNKNMTELQKTATKTGTAFNRNDFLSGKSFVTTGKSKATAQLKDAYKNYTNLNKKLNTTEDKNGIMFSGEYLEAEYKYLQAFKEASSKKVAASSLDRYTVAGMDLSDLEESLAYSRTMLQDYYSVVDEIKTSSGISQIPKEIERDIALMVQAKSQIREISETGITVGYSADDWKGIYESSSKSVQSTIALLKSQGQLTANSSNEVKESAADVAESMSSANEAISQGFSSIDASVFSEIQESMVKIVGSAQELQQALGGATTSGLVSQINEMLSKTDELQNLANILSANQDAINKVSKAAGLKKQNPKAMDEDTYSQTADQLLRTGKENLEAQYNSKLVGASVSQAANGVARITGYFQDQDEAWQKVEGVLDKEGNVSISKLSEVDTQNKANDLDKRLNYILGVNEYEEGEGKKLSQTEMSNYADQLKEKIRSVTDEYDRFNVTVDNGGGVSISKQFKDAEGNVSSFAASFGDAESLLEQVNDKFRVTLDQGFNSGSFSTTENNPSKHISDLYKSLSSSEVEYQRLSSNLVNNTQEENERLSQLKNERSKILKELASYGSEIASASDDSEIVKSHKNWTDLKDEVSSNFKGNAINDVYTKLAVAGDRSFDGSASVVAQLTSNINSLTDAYNSGKISAEEYSEKTQKLFNNFENTIAKVDTSASTQEQIAAKTKTAMQSYFKGLESSDEMQGWKLKGDYAESISENTSTMTAVYESAEGLKTIKVQANLATGEVIKLSEALKQVNKSSTASTGKYQTDKSYVGDYKALLNNEAEAKVIENFLTNNDRYKQALNERNEIYSRVSQISAQNATEENAKNSFDTLENKVVGNISTYREEIQSAFSSLDDLQNMKSNIKGVTTVFDQGRDKILKWASALASGKMSINDFENNVDALKTSLNSIYTMIKPGSNRESGITALKDMFTNLSGSADDLDFSADTSKVTSSGEIVKMTANFTDAANNARQLAGQVNLATGEVKFLGSSVKDTDSNFSKFFSGWKTKMANVAQYLTSFVALQQIWNIFKQGITVIKEFDTALTEMRKVSDEPISKLKEFQSESFDLAKSVGTTALQIQNSTADFMRLGESMDEAKQSAVNANKLLNVSEFESIDDATSALISMKAAYKDLSEESIIDRLNEVGNNYSISTDELATGLQNAGSTLSLLGNSIDESVALITAGNATIQDVNSVSSGIRTVALRIMGTEEAKDELESLGETVDDYVVETKAKKQQIIKDYTAVASNNGQGVDILDENGNYKNTYEILSEIGQIYQEIQEEDKKFGSNRASALIEELAGKNRSSVVSSILQNYELLDKVKKSSEEASGSADAENQKYLESTEAKLSLLQTQLQELATVTIDSDTFKGAIEAATSFLSLLTDIIEKVPLLQTVLGGFITKKGLGKHIVVV